jgi:hypothetical protein
MKMSGIIQRWTSEALPAHIERQFLEAKLWPRNQERWNILDMPAVSHESCHRGAGDACDHRSQNHIFPPTIRTQLAGEQDGKCPQRGCGCP